MARGITESHVHTAADEIVASGERPTVERIRAHLGTGSPNTVTRWLETWWRGLGSRLDAHQRRLSIPDVPETVAALAGEWWGMALEHARSEAKDALAREQSLLNEKQAAFQQEREELAAEAAELREEGAAASQAERLANARADELQRFVNQFEGQVKELIGQRDAALARGADADVARQAVDERLQAVSEAARLEREGLAQHVRAIEDRAHREVDLARQEAKELRARLTAATRAHAASEKASLQNTEKAKLLAAEASREAGIQRARADALEGQLAKLQDLPAALEAAWKQRPPKVRSLKLVKKRKA